MGRLVDGLVEGTVLICHAAVAARLHPWVRSDLRSSSKRENRNGHKGQTYNPHSFPHKLGLVFQKTTLSARTPAFF